MPDFKIKLINSVKFLIFVLLTILFFEIYFRATEIILPSYVYDDKELGRTHKPNALVNLVGAEGFYMGKINKYGYPGKGYPPNKEQGALRIVLIGDSYVEGFQLFERHHFARLIENDLSKILRKKVEVLNFGTGGADFRGMFLRYSKFAKKFNPDLTLFFIKREDLLEKDAIPMPEPVLTSDSLYYKFDNNNLSAENLRKRFAFIRNFSVGNLFKEVFEVIYTGRFPEALLEKIYFLFQDGNKKGNKFEQNQDKFFSFNKRICELIEKENKSTNKIFLVEVEDLPLNYEQLFRTKNIPVIKLNDELKKYSKYELKYWKASGKFGHWNQKAHIIISNYFNKYLLKLL